MTATELIAIIVSATGAIATGIAAIITGIRKADDAETLNRRVKDLEDHAEAQDRQIAALDRWKLAARHYIAQLRGDLADHGIPSREPPPELELYQGD